MRELGRRAALLVFIVLGGAAAADKPAAPSTEKVIKVTAKRFEFSPSTIELKLGEPTIIELTALDRRHGFQVPELHIDTKLRPGQPVRVRVVADKVGEFPFHCSVFCGHGHDDMVGRIVVKK